MTNPRNGPLLPLNPPVGPVTGRDRSQDAPEQETSPVGGLWSVAMLWNRNIDGGVQSQLGLVVTTANSKAQALGRAVEVGAEEYPELLESGWRLVAKVALEHT